VKAGEEVLGNNIFCIFAGKSINANCMFTSCKIISIIIIYGTECLVQ
jgi:hypothetical protein